MPTQRLVFLLHRRPDMSRQAFQHYWWTTHAPLVAARAETLGIRRYQQVHTKMPAREGQPPEFDGIAELWVDAAPTGTPEARAQAAAELLADEREFIDLARSPIWMADEHVVLDEPHEGMRITAAVRRRPDATRRQFLAHFHELHLPLVLANNDVLGFRRYVQLHTPDDAETSPLRAARGAPEPFDALSEIWLGPVTPTPARAAEALAVIRDDEEKLYDPTGTILWLSEVKVVVNL